MFKILSQKDFLIKQKQPPDMLIIKVINITDMKSELQRILKSDLSEYKIAVSDTINNLDHFQECLTQRSAFMQNFNQLLKQELERIKQQPPNEFNQIQIRQTARQPKFGPIQQQKCEYQQNFRTVSTRVVTKNHKSGSPKVTIHKPKTDVKKIERKLKQQSNNLISEHKNLRVNIISQLQTMKRVFKNDLNKTVVSIVESVNNIYENKINELESTVERLKNQNQKLKSKLEANKLQEKQVELMKYRKQIEKKVEQEVQNNKTKFIGLELRQRDFHQIENQRNQHPIANGKIHVNIVKNQPQQWKPMQMKQNRHVEFSPIYTIEKLTNTNKHFEEAYSEPPTYRETHSTNQHQSPWLGNINIQMKQAPKEMTIKNKQINWKHYVCGLQQVNLKQVKQISQTKSHQKQKKSPMKAPTYLDIQYVCTQNADSRYLEYETEPSLPVLLRKINQQRITYQIPAVKMLLIPNPPVQEGFSVLKLGNDIVYKGMWRYRKFHGRGKLTLPEYSYDGDFQYGLFHGRGTLKINNLEYIGDFYENKAEGEGKLKIGAKDISGRWRNNILISKY